MRYFIDYNLRYDYNEDHPAEPIGWPVCDSQCWVGSVVAEFATLAEAEAYVKQLNALPLSSEF